MDDLQTIKGILVDLDGVLYVGSKAIGGAVDAVTKIRNSRIQCHFVTNTSTLSLLSLQNKINTLGFSIPANEIISAPQAALLYLKSQSDPICRFLLAKDVKKDFQGFLQSDTSANYIVIGDIGSAWTYPLLNEVFNCLMEGASSLPFIRTASGKQNMGCKWILAGLLMGWNTQAGSRL